MKSVHVSYIILGAVVWAAIIAPPNISAHRASKSSAEHIKPAKMTIKIKERAGKPKQADNTELAPTELGPKALQKALFDLAVKDPKVAEEVLGKVDERLEEEKLPPIKSPITPNAPSTSNEEQQEDQRGAHLKVAKVVSDESNRGNEGHAHEPERSDIIESRSSEHPEDRPNETTKETKPGEEEDAKKKSTEEGHENEKRERASGDLEHETKVRMEETNSEPTPSEGPRETTSKVRAPTDGRHESSLEPHHDVEGRHEHETHTRLAKAESEKPERAEGNKGARKNVKDSSSDSHKTQSQEHPGSETSEDPSAERRAESHHHPTGDRSNKHAARASTEHTPELSADHVEEHNTRTLTSLHVTPHTDRSGIEKLADTALPAPTQSPVQTTLPQPLPQPLPAATDNSQGTGSLATAPVSIETPGVFGSIFQGQEMTGQMTGQE